jgi:hypothetical protein
VGQILNDNARSLTSDTRRTLPPTHCASRCSSKQISACGPHNDHIHTIPSYPFTPCTIQNSPKVPPSVLCRGGGLLHLAWVAAPDGRTRRRRHGLLPLLGLEDSPLLPFLSLTGRGRPARSAPPVPRVLADAAAPVKCRTAGDHVEVCLALFPPCQPTCRHRRSRLFRHPPPCGRDFARRASHLRSPRNPPRVWRADGHERRWRRAAPPHLPSSCVRLPRTGLLHHTPSSVSSARASSAPGAARSGRARAAVAGHSSELRAGTGRESLSSLSAGPPPPPPPPSC